MRIQLFTMVIYVCLLICVASVSARSRDKFKIYYDTAVKAVHAGDFNSCIEQLRKALVEIPTNIDANQLLGKYEINDSQQRYSSVFYCTRRHGIA